MDDPIIYAIPFFLITMLGEALWLAGRRPDLDPYESRDFWANIAMGLGSLVIGVFSGLAFGLAAEAVYDARVIDVSPAVGWTIAILGWDFVYYWSHRWAHEIRIFWASHVNHHSSQHYNLSVALRQEWGEWVRLPLYLPLALFGVEPWVIVAATAVNLVYQYWLHTEVIGTLPGWFEFVFNTPSHHRVHHGVNQQYLDRNYGSILIIWDRLFGTFEPEGERVVYGLTRNIDSFNPLVIATHEYVDIWRDVRSATTWADRIGYVVRGPGWAYARRAELDAATATATA